MRRDSSAAIVERQASWALMAAGEWCGSEARTWKTRRGPMAHGVPWWDAGAYDVSMCHGRHFGTKVAAGSHGRHFEPSGGWESRPPL